MCVVTKMTEPQAKVVLRLSVGGAKPGTKPIAFENRMKNAHVPISGRK